MSCLEKMIIQGIRSFGPEEADRQIITFHTPLTLILGPNGTGKTTIIECLKYITAGDFPPNSRGSGFVHDPKLANETEVKGQVKLKMKNVEGKSLVVQRSLMAIQKPKKVEMKTLDNSISKLLSNGQWSNVSSKCVELDKEMVLHLGVSKAVLNNVIFCHQEESSWPLGEGKMVKEKFDEIFAASRYIKALDSIRKIRTEKKVEIKILKSDIGHWEMNKTMQTKKSEQLKDMEARFDASKNSIENIEKNVKPIADKLELLSSKEGEVSKLKEKLSNQETLLKQLEKNKESYLENINDLFDGTTEELKKEIHNFSKEVVAKKRTLEEAKLSKRNSEQDCNALRNKKEQASLKLGELKVIEKQHHEKISNRENMILSSAVEYGISGTDQKDLKEEQIDMFVMKLSCKMTQSVDERDRAKAQHDVKEKSLNEQLEDVQAQKTRHEQTIKLSMDRKRQNDNEVRIISEQLRKVDNSVRKQKDLELSLSQLEARKTSFESTVDTKDIKETISEKQTLKDTFEIKLDSLNKEMNKLQLQSQTRTELEMLEKDKNAKEEQDKKLTFRHEDTLIGLMGNMPQKDAVGKLEEFGNKLQQNLRVTTKELSELKSKLSSTETTRQFKTSEMKQKENYVRVNKEKIFEVAGNGKFTDILNTLQTEIDDLQDEKGVLAGSQVVDRKYIEKIEKSLKKPCCPLCERGFQDVSDAEDLLSRLKRKNLMIPEQLETKERQITEKQKKLRLMVELRPVEEELTKVLEVELPELKTKLENFDSQIAKLKKTIVELEKTHDTAQEKLKIVSSIQPDMVLLHQHQNELEKLNKQVSTLKEKLESQGGIENIRSIKEVSNEREDVQSKLQKVSKFLKESQEKISNYNEEMHSLNEKINSQRSELLNIKGDQQKRTSLEEQKHKLIMDSKKIEVEVEESKSQIEALKKQLKFIKEEKEKVRRAMDEEMRNFNSIIDKLMKSKDNIDDLTRSIISYIKAGQTEKLEKFKKNLEDLNGQLEVKEHLVRESLKEIEKIQKDLANQELRERELQDNVKLKECEVRINSLKTECKAFKDKIGDIDTTNLFKEKRDLTSQYNKMTLEKESLAGRLRELRSQIKDVSVELNEEPLKNAHKNYREKFYDLRIMELSSDDLNKYHKALDTAVMKYHGIKMNEINKIIRELWRKTYRGNDIDYVEICSDQPENATGTDGRKVYNYRVVMVNKDVHIDMRGRCSAGQKVLASLIIRIALAETFCLNCGILALDEPTTNLDRENIESLANALTEIVSNRSRQKNFQLVIITHDEEFIDVLGRNNEVEYFYKVGKDARCCSQIERCRFENIQLG